MAIIVEEAKKGTSYFGILGWLVFLVAAAAAAYYIFFAAPELVVIPETGNISTIEPIVTVGLDPSSVVSSTVFQSLTSTVPLPTPDAPASKNRPNPFIAP